MKKMPIKLLVADDFDLIRQGVKRIIEFEADIEILGEATDGDQVLEMVDELNPDVLLLDMNMPIKNGLAVLKAIRDKKLNLKILILTVENDYQIIKEAIHMGADGYILKESVGKEVVEAIHTVSRGEKYIDKSVISLMLEELTNQQNHAESKLDELTNRETDILYLISRGYNNKEIGEELFISEKTVKNYASKIFKKIDVTDRVKATIFALDHDIDQYYQSSKKDLH